MTDSILEIVDGSPDTLVAWVALPAPPAVVFDYLVRADLLPLWWPERAETEPWSGGRYELHWDSAGWCLQGQYLQCERGRSVEFTWAWTHEPDHPERTVALDLEDAGDETRMKLVHGSYGSSEAEQAQRQSHLEGWTHFLTRLRDTLAHR